MNRNKYTAYLLGLISVCSGFSKINAMDSQKKTISSQSNNSEYEYWCRDGVKYELNKNHLTITGPEDCKGCKLGQISRSEYLRDKVRTVEFKGNITSIGEYAFFGCKNLLSIEIPGSATEIGKDYY